MAPVLEQMLAPGPQERFDLDATDECLPVLQDLQRRFGDICRVPAASRPNDGLVIHTPDVIRHVLLTNRANYIKGVGTERVRVLLGNGLITSDGEVWARQRKMIQPAFHGQVVRDLAPLMQQVHDGLLARWSAAADRGETIDLTRDLSDAALAVVLKALLGPDLDRLIADTGANPFELLTAENKRDLAFAAGFRALAPLVRDLIRARRDQPERAGERDLLAILLAARDPAGQPMSDRMLIDEIMTLVVAGHETTASTLNWTWYLLSCHPEVEADLHRAVDAEAGAAPADGAVIERILQEAMRLYPPVWLFSRRALAADVLGGYAVPAGTDVFIAPYLLHRHPAYWDRPDAFDPGRFAPATAAGRSPFLFLPFSAGPRHCIGSGFAMAEMASHLSTIARRFTLRHAGEKPPEPEFQINLRSRESIRMRPLPRA